MVFKSSKTGRVDSIPLAEIETTRWLRVARGFGLKVSLKNGQYYKYDGFKEVVCIYCMHSFTSDLFTKIIGA